MAGIQVARGHPQHGAPFLGRFAELALIAKHLALELVKFGGFGQMSELGERLNRQFVVRAAQPVQSLGVVLQLRGLHHILEPACGEITVHFLDRAVRLAELLFRGCLGGGFVSLTLSCVNRRCAGVGSTKARHSLRGLVVGVKSRGVLALFAFNLAEQCQHIAGFRRGLQQLLECLHGKIAELTAAGIQALSILGGWCRLRVERQNGSAD